MFAGLGHYEIEIKVDSSAANAFFQKKRKNKVKKVQKGGTMGKLKQGKNVESVESVQQEKKKGASRKK